VGDHIIDTNVLLIASAHHPDSPFKDADHVPFDQKQIVLDWLMEFRSDAQRTMVLDRAFKIWDEYHNQMVRGQDIGSLVAAEKLQFARFVDVSYDRHGYASLPAELKQAVPDRADWKFVAVALADVAQGNQSSIVNASDSDWYDGEGTLAAVGLSVEHLIDDWCRAKWKQKKAQKQKRKR
jgi:hypothetical protein